MAFHNPIPTGPRIVKRKPPPLIPSSTPTEVSQRYPPLYASDPFAPLSVLRTRDSVISLETYPRSTNTDRPILAQRSYSLYPSPPTLEVPLSPSHPCTGDHSSDSGVLPTLLRRKSKSKSSADGGQAHYRRRSQSAAASSPLFAPPHSWGLPAVIIPEQSVPSSTRSSPRKSLTPNGSPSKASSRLARLGLLIPSQFRPRSPSPTPSRNLRSTIISGPISLPLSAVIPGPRATAPSELINVGAQSYAPTGRRAKSISVSSSSSSDTATTHATDTSSAPSSQYAATNHVATASRVSRVKAEYLSASALPMRPRPAHRARNASVSTPDTSLNTGSNFSFVLVAPNASTPVLSTELQRTARRRSFSAAHYFSDTAAVSVPKIVVEATDVQTRLPTSYEVQEASALHIVAPSGVLMKFGDLWRQRAIREVDHRLLVVCFTRGSWSPMGDSISHIDPGSLQRAGVDCVVIGDGSNGFPNSHRHKFPVFCDHPTLPLYAALGMDDEVYPSPKELKSKSKHTSLSSIGLFMLRTLRLGKRGQLGGVFVFGPGAEGGCIWAKTAREGEKISMRDALRGAGMQMNIEDDEKVHDNDTPSAVWTSTPRSSQVDLRLGSPGGADEVLAMTKEEEDKWMEDRESSLSRLRNKKSLRRDRVVTNGSDTVHEQAIQEEVEMDDVNPDTSADTATTGSEISEDHVLIFEEERALVQLHKNSARWRTPQSLESSPVRRRASALPPPDDEDAASD